MTRAGTVAALPKKKAKRQALKRQMKKYKWFYLIMLPGILYFIIYKYVPMWGLLIICRTPALWAANGLD